VAKRDEPGGHPGGDPLVARRRLLDALLESIGQKGFRATTVTDIVRLARTSRRTFYEWFETREECYLALIDASDLEMHAKVGGAVDPRAPWTEQIRQATAAYVEHVAANPVLTLTSIRELPSLGEPALVQDRRTLDAFADLLNGIVDNPRFREAGVRPVSRYTAQLLLGGIKELTAMVVEDGGDVREMTETIVQAALALLRPAPTPD
jgi:AcrR family transcriptional regulator